MIDTQGNVTRGRPRKGHQMVEYQRVKNHIVELMDAETPDPEIAAIIGVSRATYWSLKKRILREVIDTKIAERVAAREFMRLNHQEAQVVKYLNSCWASDTPPDASYIGAFVNISKRIAELIGANAAIAVQVENIDADRADQINKSQTDLARALNRFYALGTRVADGGIGSGLTEEEREREYSNMIAALGTGAIEGQRPPNPESMIVDAEVVDDDEDVDGDDDNEDSGDDSSYLDDDIELMEIPLEDDEDSSPELIEIPKFSGAKRMAAHRAIALNTNDPETPGRWIAGKWVSWWHDKGDSETFPDYGDTYDDGMDSEEIDDAPADLDGPNTVN